MTVQPQNKEEHNSNEKQVSSKTPSSAQHQQHQQHQQQHQQQQQINDRGIVTTLGKGLTSFSDLINNNLIAARYGTFATITLLTAYGISRTPIFFRFKRVSDIPAQSFAKRQTIYGRIVHVVDNNTTRSYNTSYNNAGKASISSNTANTNTNNNNGKSQLPQDQEEPIVCLIRHSSPLGRLLNKSSMEYFMRHNPSSHLKKDSNIEDAKDLLKVEIAGVKSPPYQYSNGNEWLKQLAANRTPVSCTLLSRRIVETSSKKEEPRKNEDLKLNITSRTMKEQQQQQSPIMDADLEQTAICHVKYRPAKAFFRQDLGSSIVRHGKAGVASGIHIDIPSMPTIHGSTKLGNMEADVKYLESLVSDEFEAVKERKGIWSVEAIRNERPDLIDEADFEINASIFSKLWRRITQR